MSMHNTIPLVCLYSAFSAMPFLYHKDFYNLSKLPFYILHMKNGVVALQKWTKSMADQQRFYVFAESK